MSYLYDPVAEISSRTMAPRPSPMPPCGRWPPTPGLEVTYTAATPGSGSRIAFNQ